jgi:positive regulator of sigma E activity
MWTRADVSRAARLACRHSVQPGDTVRVHLPANHLLRGTLLLHGLPLASILAGGALGAFVGQSDLGCLAGALTGIASMLAVTPSLRQKIERLTVERVSVEPVQ